MSAGTPPRTPGTPATVDWGPGCGNRTLADALQDVLSAAGIAPHAAVFVCGTGCTARLADRLGVYGVHSVPGPAAAVASGIARVSPGLEIWLICDADDALGSGMSAFTHLLRRDLDVTCLLLTGANAGRVWPHPGPSPQIGTARIGIARTDRGPPCDRHPEDALTPARLALAAGAGFVARTGEDDASELARVLAAARAHRGSAVVEVRRTCHEIDEGSAPAPDDVLPLVEGAPLRYGVDGSKALRLDPRRLALSAVSHDGGTDDAGDALLHDPANRTRAMLLADLPAPGPPEPRGILFRAAGPGANKKRAAGHGAKTNGASDATPPEPDLQARRDALAAALRRAPTWDER